jgi:hypothetical protein
MVLESQPTGVSKIRLKKIRRDPFINSSILNLLSEDNHDRKSVENKDSSFDSLSFP